MVNQAEVITIVKEGRMDDHCLRGPMLLVAIVIGLIVSVIQATTQINEQVISFVPKMIGILLALLIFGGWILGNLSDFTLELYQSIISYTG
jgi:flagellar biosynthetic protein FliQ